MMTQNITTSNHSEPPASLFFESSKLRRLLLAAAIYVVCELIFFVCAEPSRIFQHTPYNHFAHLADAWLHGRQSIVDGGPSYAGRNDFAEFEGKTYISFPPFPAILMVPFVKLAGSAEDFLDGQFVLWLAGIGPSVLFLILEKLKQSERNQRSELTNFALSMLMAVGSVYFFTAVQGTVWYAGHVVGVAVMSLYIFFALDSTNPLLAGFFLGASFLSRPTTSLSVILFVFESFRSSLPTQFSFDSFSSKSSYLGLAKVTLAKLDKPRFLRLIGLFSLPVCAALCFASWTNYTRFHTLNPTSFGHEHLSVAWQKRMTKWGLFGYHYLSKNLACMLTTLPWFPPRGASQLDGALFKINLHGLALWFTTPAYLWIFGAKNKTPLFKVLILSLLGPLFLNLFYQNTGWMQFGYRFSNDYVLFLFMLLAVGNQRMSPFFWLAALWGIGWNAFGALSFERASFAHYYFFDPTQTVVFQLD